MTRKITIVGLGSGELEQLSLGTYRILKESHHLYIRTEDHPIVADLKAEGLKLETFDNVYTSFDTFEAVYDEIVRRLLQAAQEQDVVYGVPGHPMVAEKTVQMLLELAPNEGVEVRIAGGQSFLDPLFSALRIDPIEGLHFVDATSLNPDQLLYDQHLVVCQIYDGLVASEVKLTLLEHYPPDYEVTLVQAAGDRDEKIKKVLLAELDYDWSLDNRTSLYVPPIKDVELTNHSFPRLRDIIRTLRAPEGCPWDREQTHESLRKYLVEETYEVLAAIEEKDDDHLVEELGDVLLQVMLHAQIGEDEGFFNIYDVIKGLSDKMIRRHPHVFGEVSVNSSDDVLTNWEAIKKNENAEQKRPASLLKDIDHSLPPLLYALELQKKAAKVGFDWPNIEGVWAKIYEELEECREEERNETTERLESELGDVFFSIVNLARKYRIDPFVALSSTNQKFFKRFSIIEEEAIARGISIQDLSLEEMEEIWIRAKEI